MTKHPHKNRKYSIVQYDKNWVNQFNDYVSKIKNIFGDRVQIEHIGSTSVSGMLGKPSIDILVIVKDLKILDKHIKDLENIGFQYDGAFVTKDSRLFRVIEDDTVLANVHFFPNEHEHIKEMINLRDYFRTHINEVEKYSKTKEHLYSKYPKDYASYRKYKDEYMENLKSRIHKNES